MSGDEAIITVEAAHGITAVPAEAWDACAAPETAAGGRPNDPFTTHRFLSALEESGAATAATGWAPLHLLARREGRLVAAMPLWIKSHSFGEYVFDHAWADAWERAGGRYYPKLQVAVPFTPVTGRRLLIAPRPPAEREALARSLVAAAIRIAGEHAFSSLHITFCAEEEWALGARWGLLRRTDQQFHWFNRGYGSFDDFLAALASRKRKQIRRERRQAVAAGLRLHRLQGDDLRPDHWDAFWRFYQDTGARKWGRPYLTRAFFDHLHQSMRDDVLLVMAERDGHWVAGALNLIGREALYGRYWGCIEHHPCLHFETCYYQAIEFAIEAGLARVEAGAQGPHKLARGYEPVTTYSMHWIADPVLRRAVADYLGRERAAVAEENRVLSEHLPFRRDRAPGGGSDVE